MKLRLEVVSSHNRAMPKAKPSIPKPAQLRDAFVADLASCWQCARSLHPKETPYAFVLFGVEGTAQLNPHVLTEHGLEVAAKRYISKGHYEKAEEARKELRYSIEDSPYCLELKDKLPTVDALMEPLAQTLDETKGYSILTKAAMEAFEILDKRGTFGAGKQRENCLLMIDTSFTEKDWSLPSVKRLNSPRAVKRYEAETTIEGVDASCHELTFSPNGKCLYFAGQREIDPRKEKSVWEIVACDIAGLQVKRRWHCSFPQSGGFRGITATSAGKHVYAITNQLRGAEKATIIKFASSTGEQIRTHSLPGAAQAITVVNGQRIAVATGDESLHVLDPDLNEVRVVKLKSYPFTVQALRSGELLVGCERALVRVENAITHMPFKKDVVGLSTDQAETMLAVSRTSDFLASYSERTKEFGFQIFAPPGFKLKRTVTIPGFQLFRARVSPNGKLIACRAEEIEKRQDFIVVFESSTFREVARRQCRHVTELTFSPDSRLLAFTKSGLTTTEPVQLWKIPTS